MNKLKKALVMVLALAMVLTCAMVTPVQAAGKLNKKSVSIYETETVSLTVKGVKSVTWKTSDKKIATVDKKGLVKGVKKGTCTVTAKDTKTKAAYSCKVTVKQQNHLELQQRILVYSLVEKLFLIRERKSRAQLMYWMERNSGKRITVHGQIRMESV